MFPWFPHLSLSTLVTSTNKIWPDWSIAREESEEHSFYSFFSYKTLDWLLLLRLSWILLSSAVMRSLAFSISGEFYAAIRSIWCALPVLLEERYICLETGVKKRKMLENGINRKVPSAANAYKIFVHEMHKNLYLLWTSNRWSCQVTVKRKINCNISEPPELSGEETHCIQLSAHRGWGRWQNKMGAVFHDVMV